MKLSLNQIKNRVESYSSRVEQVEDRSSGLNDKMDSNETTEDFLDKRLKVCKKNTQQFHQELSDSITKPNLQVMGTEEGEVQANCMHNIAKKIIAKNSQILERDTHSDTGNLQDIKQTRPK
jgi:septal ring factor EnvC (AmiA/AmiB activator)